MYSYKQQHFWSPATGDDLIGRKQEWRNIVKNLRILKHQVSAKAHKYHKELYFNGRLHDDLLVTSGPKYGELVGVKVFSDKTLFHMWYHPEPSVELFTEMINANEHSSSVLRLRGFFLVTNIPLDFPTEYGLMGGREQMIAQALFPSIDNSEVRQFEHGEAPMGLQPDFVFGKCPGATLNTLRYSGAYNPHSMGRYLWPHFDYALQYKMDECKSTKFFGKRMCTLLEALRAVMDFYDRDGLHQHCKPAIELREELKEQFDAKAFGSTLMNLWEQEKARYEAGDPTPSEYVEA